MTTESPKAQFHMITTTHLYTNSQSPMHRFFQPEVSVQDRMHFGVVHPSFVSKGTSYRNGLVVLRGNLFKLSLR